MTNKPYIKIGNTYTPRTSESKHRDTEIIGPMWRAWRENEAYFYEFDAGHFASSMKKVQISKDEFLALQSGSLSDLELNRRYGK